MFKEIKKREITKIVKGLISKVPYLKDSVFVSRVNSLIDDKLNSINSSITNIRNSINTLTNNLNSAKNTLQNNINNLENKVNTDINNISDLNTRVNSNTSSINTINNRLDNFTTVTPLGYTLHAISKNIIANYGKLINIYKFDKNAVLLIKNEFNPYRDSSCKLIEYNLKLYDNYGTRSRYKEILHYDYIEIFEFIFLITSNGFVITDKDSNIVDQITFNDLKSSTVLDRDLHNVWIYKTIFNPYDSTLVLSIYIGTYSEILFFVIDLSSGRINIIKDFKLSTDFNAMCVNGLYRGYDINHERSRFYNSFYIIDPRNKKVIYLSEIGSNTIRPFNNIGNNANRHSIPSPSGNCFLIDKNKVRWKDNTNKDIKIVDSLIDYLSSNTIACFNTHGTLLAMNKYHTGNPDEIEIAIYGKGSIKVNGQWVPGYTKVYTDRITLATASNTPVKFMRFSLDYKHLFIYLRNSNKLHILELPPLNVGFHC